MHISDRTFVRHLFPFLLVLIFHGQASCQDEFQIDWINNDLTPYDTYSIEEIKINGQAQDLKGSEGIKAFTKAFNKNMAKIGLEASRESVLHVLFDMKMDTLPIAYQRIEGPRPEDRIFDLHLTMKDVEVNETLVYATFRSVSKGPKKLNKQVRKMINTFFEEAQMEN